MPADDRFWAKVDKHGPVPDARPDLGPCWVWTGTIERHGYARITVGARHDREMAHRFSLRLAGVEIPEGMEADHLCFVRHCVRPSHLEVVTPWVNKSRNDSWIKAGGVNREKARCQRGHEYTPENTKIERNDYGGPSRRCLTCRRERDKARRAA